MFSFSLILSTVSYASKAKSSEIGCNMESVLIISIPVLYRHLVVQKKSHFFLIDQEIINVLSTYQISVIRQKQIMNEVKQIEVRQGQR